MHAFCEKPQILQEGGVGIYLSSRHGPATQQTLRRAVCSSDDANWRRIAAWFYCARLRGIRLQNGAGKIANGMNELENNLAGWG